jgi:hypothetical protein
MKLYELSRGMLFTLKEQPKMPPDVFGEVDTQKVYKLHNIDGMYSYVTDTGGMVYHFAAWTEVEKFEHTNS